jgi:hypothetical protein
MNVAAGLAIDDLGRTIGLFDDEFCWELEPTPAPRRGPACDQVLP